MKKLILDACCGGRMFWFDKKNPNVLYMDCRKEDKGFLEERPNFCVKPDKLGDFRDIDYPDESFKMVVWDPPHTKKRASRSIISKKYGDLDPSWREDLHKGFNECWRVLEDYGVLIFKWNENEIPLKEVLKQFHTTPLFGNKSPLKNKTHWLCFMKIPKVKK